MYVNITEIGCLMDSWKCLEPELLKWLRSYTFCVTRKYQ